MILIKAKQSMNNFGKALERLGEGLAKRERFTVESEKHHAKEKEAVLLGRPPFSFRSLVQVCEAASSFWQIPLHGGQLQRPRRPSSPEIRPFC